MGECRNDIFQTYWVPGQILSPSETRQRTPAVRAVVLLAQTRIKANSDPLFWVAA